MQPALSGLNDFFRMPSEYRWLDVSGRLKPGITHREAQSELSTIAAAQRTHEIGIRQAIGARRIDVFRLIVRLVARPLMIGLPIGIALAALLGKLFQRMELLVGLNPRDH